MNSPSRQLTPPAGTVRIAPVASIPRVLEHLGFDPEATLSEMGFDLALFKNPENVIPYVARNRLLEQCADKTGCRHFGHLVARNSTPSSFGIAGCLIQQAPDVASALRAFVRYLHLHVDGAVSYLEENKASAFFGYSITYPGDEETEQVSHAAVTAIFNTLRKLCGEKWQPTEVCFTHKTPENTRPMRQYFKAPLRYNAGRNGVAFPIDLLQLQMAGSDPELGLLQQGQIDQLEKLYSDDFAEQVRRVTHTAVLTHHANAPHVARLFSIHQRTLHRRLRECDTCFRDILDDTRYEIASRLLSDSALKLADIANTLDYADASAFARAFQRQSGKAPSLWREENHVVLQKLT